MSRSTTDRPAPLTAPRAVLFDLDGTLTRPLLDFDAIRRDMGIGPGPILEAMAKMNEVDRAAATAVLDRHELTAAAESTLNPGCHDLLDWLACRRIKVAIITRNSRRNLRTVCDKHGIAIDTCLTRDDGPAKPDPAPLQLACRRLGVSIDQSWMVGDGSHDIEAGLAAGMKTVWLSHGKPRPFAATPWSTVVDLSQLLAVLRSTVVETI